MQAIDESVNAMSNYSLKLTNNTINLENVLIRNIEFKFVLDYTLLTTMVIVMFSIGCEITWEQIKKHIKHPLCIIVGLVSQFFIIPLTTYTLLRSCGVKGHHATGVLIISCCPGGILSNCFAYFCDGNMSLSVTMTFISTLTAMGMMPFNLWIYGNSFETENLVVPYGRIALPLISIIAPVMVGMLLQWKFPNVIRTIKKVVNCISITGIFFCVIFQIIIFPDMFTNVPRSVRGILLTLPPLGLSLGYVLAYSFKQDVFIRKTIATECGIQNVPTAIAIITTSFEQQFQDSMLLLPWLYTFVVMSGSIVLCLIYQMHKHYISFKRRKENSFNLVV